MIYLYKKEIIKLLKESNILFLRDTDTELINTVLVPLWTLFKVYSLPFITRFDVVCSLAGFVSKQSSVLLLIQWYLRAVWDAWLTDPKRAVFSKFLWGMGHVDNQKK